MSALNDWVLKHHDEAVSYHTPQEEVHFWLSAFARAVREEAIKRYEGSLFEISHTVAMSDAFNSLCQRFGLELEGK